MKMQVNGSRDLDDPSLVRGSQADVAEEVFFALLALRHHTALELP